MHSDGRMVHVMMEQGTVAEALDQAGIALGADDMVVPRADSAVADGMEIKVIRVQVRVSEKEEAIPFKVSYKKDSTLAKGKEKVSSEGKNGVRVVKTEVILHDGVEVSLNEISSEVSKEPVNKVIRQGTKTATPKPTAKKTPTPKPTPSPTPKPVLVKNDEGAITRVKSGSKTYSVQEKMVVEITAYTHTGDRTATGTMPKVGTIAVDRDVIPLGTMMYVPGYGIGKAEDVGVGGEQIDVFLESERQCLKWGRKRGVTIYILK